MLFRSPRTRNQCKELLFWLLFGYNRNVWVGSDWFTYDGDMLTPACFDAKGTCDDVSQVSICTGDLRDCYDEEYNNNIEGLFPAISPYPPHKYLMDNAFGPQLNYTIYNSSAAEFQTAPANTSPGTAVYNLAPGSVLADRTTASRAVSFKSNTAISPYECNCGTIPNDCQSCELTPNPNCPGQEEDNGCC